MMDLLETFLSHAESAGSTVHTVPDPPAAVAILRAFVGPGSLTLSPAIPREWPAVVNDLASYQLASDDPAVATDAPVGVVHGDLAVSETGSVLVREDDLRTRLVSMFASRVVQLVRLDDLVASLDEVADRLADRSAGPGYTVLMTGPSKTADIERSLTIGVQGPSTVDVVLVG